MTVVADDLGVRENVLPHGMLKLGFGSAGIESQFEIQRVEFEEIAVRPTLWRTRVVVTNFSEVVFAPHSEIPRGTPACFSRNK